MKWIAASIAACAVAAVVVAVIVTHHHNKQCFKSNNPFSASVSCR